MNVGDKEYLEAVTSTDKGRRHVHTYYAETVDHAKTMGVHVEGFLPRELLEINRPNEDQKVKDYRLATWRPVTTSLSNKIINTVNRIFNPKLFRIEYPDDIASVPESEQLQKYYSEQYGIYQNIWVFVRETLLKLTFSDPNAVCFIWPENWLNLLPAEMGGTPNEAEFLRPLPLIYRSKEVVDFKEEHYYTFYTPPVKSNFSRGVKGSKGKLIIVDEEKVSIRIGENRQDIIEALPIVTGKR